MLDFMNNYRRRQMASSLLSHQKGEPLSILLQQSCLVFLKVPLDCCFYQSSHYSILVYEQKNRANLWVELFN